MIPKLLPLFSFLLFTCSFPKTMENDKPVTLERISEHTYIHLSYLQTESFGKVGCNGMVVVNKGRAIIFDTPATDQDTGYLINLIQKDLKAEVIAVVPTHFHADCLGGLAEVHKRGIISYAYSLTSKLAQNAGAEIPQQMFDGNFTLPLEDLMIEIKFAGEGHTKDNVVAYVTADSTLFGGCLVKELDATKGYLGDANIAAWPQTIDQVLKFFPMAKNVVPGHGKWGDKTLLEYTKNLFLENKE